MTPTEGAHSLTANEFAELASGFGSTQAVQRLVVAQSSIQRELLAAVGQFGPQYDRRFAAAWELLTALDETTPDAVGTVLAHPYTRVWAVGLLNDLYTGAFPTADVYHLEAVVAGAAVHAGVDLRVPVPVRSGVAPLPTFGMLRVGTDDRVQIDTGSPEDLDLVQPLRRMTATGLTVTLEDTDPYRTRPYTNTGIHPTDRVSRDQVWAWRSAFVGAIEFIDLHLPGYGPGLRAGLRAVTPLRSNGTNDRSASARLAFGAVGLASHHLAPAPLGLLLIHEFQHVKLGAMLDMFELFDLSDTQPRYAPPCFVHPRPIEGLLQSTYAYLGVCDFWRTYRSLTTGSENAEAEQQFARSRTLTAAGVEQLLTADSLTPMGTRFVELMARTLTPWIAEPVDHEAEAIAARALADHRSRERALSPRPL
ncbi:MAG: motif protein [Nocardia sp.]|uniref:aKG-HExxH-type peptide beta-hydroxylase n=1 Tax=Nocardia sp. TaxID=1821 RepID=UPI00260E7258|nr:HEXXH motif-containing putative peptide modification protein [Nocardia sp.]MCU1644068.1 motif protein [Nocardia sp.]